MIIHTNSDDPVALNGYRVKRYDIKLMGNLDSAHVDFFFEDIPGETLQTPGPNGAHFFLYVHQQDRVLALLKLFQQPDLRINTDDLARLAGFDSVDLTPNGRENQEYAKLKR